MKRNKAKEIIARRVLKRIKRATEDRISKLPDEIIAVILSLLPMKTITRMRVLSKRWRHVWTLYPYLHFNHDDLGTRGNRETFVRIVDHFLHFYNGEELKRFQLSFYIGEKYSPNAKEWVHFAIQRRVQELDLDFMERAYYVGVPFELPDCVFYCGSSITKLSLSQCEFNSFTYKGFVSLKCLSLTNCKLRDEQIHRVVADCLCLESLTLNNCNHIINLKISMPDLRLKTLTLSNCWHLRKFYLFAPNLLSLHYRGNFIAFSFENISCLANITLNIGRLNFMGARSNYRKFVVSLAHISTVTICSSLIQVLSSELFFSRITPPRWFPCLKELHLLNDIMAEHMLLVLTFFSTCPLEQLVIDMSRPCGFAFVCGGDNDYWREQLKAVVCVFSHLKKVIIKGFERLDDKTWLMGFLLEKAVVLESFLIVAPRSACIHLAREEIEEIEQLPRSSLDAKIIFE
ncbi:F-box protein At5g03100-like [Tasmannia lanceolata]|uniref:F-box protein At5g03100-like n=1 Tax=Tasmannia lanceolata TaxID=3420 RepID=UPI004063EB78